MSKIPIKSTFQDRKKEASFWEGNFNQAWDNGKPAKVQFARNLSETINVRFDSHTMTTIRNQAQEKGLGATQLIRMWIMEKLQGAANSQTNNP